MKALKFILAASLILLNACQPGSSSLVIPFQEGLNRAHSIRNIYFENI